MGPSSSEKQDVVIVFSFYDIYYIYIVLYNMYILYASNLAVIVVITEEDWKEIEKTDKFSHKIQIGQVKQTLALVFWNLTKHDSILGP